MAPSPLSKNDGSIAVLAIIILGALSAAILLFAMRSAHGTMDLKKKILERQAVYTAESGIEYACAEARRIKALQDSTNKSGIVNSEGIIRADSAVSDSQPLTILDEGSFTYYPFSDSLLGSAYVSGKLMDGFLQVTSTGHYKTASKTIVVKLGTRLPKIFDAGLILSGPRPLLVDGGTLNGSAVLKVNTMPSGAFLEMEFLKGDLPEINEKLFKKTMDNLLSSTQISDTGKSAISQLISYNFSNKPDFTGDSMLTHAGNVLINGDRFNTDLVIEGPGTIESGQGIQLTGRVFLKKVTLIAQGDLACFDNARLEECVLLSYTRVHLGNKTDFSGTIYSNGTVEILNEAKVRPFALIYARGQGGKGAKTVQIDEQAVVAGTVIVPGRNGLVYIGYEALFCGVLFCRGSVDIRGNVKGAVAAVSFMARRDEAQPYANVFIDGRIDRTELPYNYSAPLGLLTEPDFEVVGWDVE
ncbi:MAG: hypothetical protein A2487_19305 [Candidatus Raymondbacteria bacterium RifOxyC12_full_50_8]|nr:MAG: hypothetical protein A2487_19305 [Candidatus Raymondbacteria bacterium RifOxyC12_full_50_8]